MEEAKKNEAKAMSKGMREALIKEIVSIVHDLPDSKLKSIYRLTLGIAK